MARPQLEDGFTRVANEILEHLARLSLSPNGWKILMCVIRKTYGFNKKVDRIANFQIVDATGLRKDTVSRALNELKGKDVIVRNGKQIGLQKDWQRWKFAESSTAAIELAESSTSKSLRNRQPQLAESQTKVGSSLVTQKKKETIQKKDIYIVILDVWNSRKIIKHKKLTDEIQRSIKSSLENHSFDEIVQAIKNYAIIVHGEEYYFKYRWTLKDFLKRGLEKFLDLEVAKQNYAPKGDIDGAHPRRPRPLRPRETYTKPEDA